MRKQITSSITRAVMPEFIRGASYGLVAICATFSVLGAITYSVVAADHQPTHSVEHAASLTAPPLHTSSVHTSPEPVPESIREAQSVTALIDDAPSTAVEADSSVVILPSTPTIDTRVAHVRAKQAAAQAALNTTVELARLKAAWEPHGPTAGDLLFQLSIAAPLPEWKGPAETAQEHLADLSALGNPDVFQPPPPPHPALVRPAPTYRVLTVAPEELRTRLEAAFGDEAAFASRVIMCESHANATANTGNGYYGMWQFDLPTWHSVGGTGLPSDASIDEQIMRARMLYDARGWQPWHCALLVPR